MYGVVISLFLVPFLSILVYFFLVHKYSRFFVLMKKLPGPKGYPIVGNVLCIHGTREKTFAMLRKFARDFYPIYSIYSLNIGSVHLLHPDDVEIVLSNSKYNKKEFPYVFLKQWLGEGLLTSHGPQWINRRKILTSAFHFSILQEFLIVFHEESAKLVTTITEQSKTDNVLNIEPLIVEFTLQSMAETSMGVRIDKNSSTQGDYKQAVNDFTDITSQRVIRPWIYSPLVFSLTQDGKLAEKATKILHEFSRRILKDRKKTFEKSEDAGKTNRKRQAMLDLLLTARREGADIDDEGIREEIDTFMFEGHDTTELAICHILLLVASHPQVQQNIYTEISEVIGPNDKIPSFNDYKDLQYTDRCIKECLRLCPSVPSFSRINESDIETSTGYTIPKGTLVFIHPYDLHHNPDVFPDPEKFDPDRFLPENCRHRHPYAYIPFSAGPRNCIGQKFAMLELKAVLCAVLRNFHLEAVDTKEDVFEYPFDLLLRPKNGIKIKFNRRDGKIF